MVDVYWPGLKLMCLEDDSMKVSKLRCMWLYVYVFSNASTWFDDAVFFSWLSALVGGFTSEYLQFVIWNNGYL